MKVKVTQRHIDKGLIHSCMYCPIALAVKEKQHQKVSVGISSFRIHVSFTSLMKDRCYSLPKEAIKFINDFDRGAVVRPFEVEAKLIKM